MKNLSIGKILIWGSILAYLVGVIWSITSWFIHRQIDNDLAWNWEIIYGPLITLAFYWVIGGLVSIFMWTRAKGKLEKSEL
jgi:ABC-type multidrug transport system permease subunit